MTDETAIPPIAVAETAAVAETTQAILPQPTGAVCANCGTALFGEHCYHCGQPTKGLVRRFSSVIGDVADTLFEIDTRLTRTVAPLLLRPGFLSNEYFAGRRVRYVSPVRLFFFISVLAFFAAQWSVDASNSQAFHVEEDTITSATTVAEVDRQRNVAVREMAEARAVARFAPGAVAGMKQAESQINRKADERIAELNAAKAKGIPPPEHVQQLTFGNDGKPWDPATNPLRVGWLPSFGNSWLNSSIGRARGNVARIKHNPNLLFDAWLSAMPSTLFLLLPLFAVLLKIAYVFKRRLYMEHFIVALHSHAFLCFALLLVLVLNGLTGVTPSPWLHVPLKVATVALIIWMPLYLLLMQKRVYQQGWLMTTLKYGVLGVTYVLLLSVGAAASLAVKIVWL